MTPLQLTGLLWALCLAVPAAAAPHKNGFDLEGASLPVDEILHGGPPRDGIPAIDHPRFLPADEADFLDPEDPVLGVWHGGEARAYPVKILDWHEIVNDRIGGTPIAVTYCPLCGSGVVFRAEVAGEALSFGVSGLLYNSDVLLYDRQTDSLWSQLLHRAVTGPHNRRSLTPLPVRHTTWAAWRKRHPDTGVLSDDTGHARDYRRSPYAGYAEARALYFPVSGMSPRYHPKEPVLGVEVDGQFKAYPFSELAKQGRPGFSDTLGGRTLTLEWDAEAYSAAIAPQSGVSSTRLFWFAWYAFHPDTAVFTAP